MTDIADLANDRAGEQLADAIEEQRRRAAREMPDPRLPAAEYCEAPCCGALIPEARRLALPGVRLCVQCQANIERAHR